MFILVERSTQIKKYDKVMQDSKQIENDSKNRVLLIEKLELIINNKPQYEYLISPIYEILDELENSISFSKYVRQDEVIKKLKQQREEVKIEIFRQTKKLKIYDVEEKKSKIIILKDLLVQKNKIEDLKVLQEKRNRIKDIKRELQYLQNTEDTSKINEISSLIND